MGWARANILYEKLEGPPEPGTPLESVILMVWMARQEIEMQNTRAIVQSVLAASTEAPEAGKELQESWRDYIDSIFPFQRGSRKSADRAALEYLVSEVQRGPLAVTPLAPVGRVRSKLRTRHLNWDEVKHYGERKSVSGVREREGGDDRAGRDDPRQARQGPLH